MNNKKKIVLIVALLILVIIFATISVCNENNNYTTYKEFNSELESGNITSVIIEDEKVKFFKGNDKTEYYTDNPEYDDFKKELLLNGTKVTTNSSVETTTMLFDMLFYIIFFGAIIFVAYKIIDTNKNTFKVIRHTKVKFDDIAGMKELKKDMMQVVDILKNPNKFLEKGIRQTKGIIFEGTPGNGKTLFAKALAAEADVSFIATKGADFQSAMMSVGARKIKLLV